MGGVFVDKQAPRPSEVYDVLWRFAVERQRIYHQRVRGQDAPWTEDTVLCTYRFTNAYRAADRVSQYFIRMIYAEAGLNTATIVLRTLLFKIFNKVQTWEAIVDELGLPVAGEFDFEACEALLGRLRAERKAIYSSAYIMPSGGKTGGSKHAMHLALLKRMLNEDLPAKLAATESLSEAYELLLAYPTMGPFLAFQYAIDLNYSTLFDHDEASFVVAGPGAIDGLSKCFTSLGDYSPAEAICWVTRRQDEEFARLEMVFEDLWGRSLQPIDVQNLFCEISKYTRATHPHVQGRAGRTRIKRKFASSGAVQRPFFPPKWGINAAIDTKLGPDGTRVGEQQLSLWG